MPCATRSGRLPFLDTLASWRRSEAGPPWHRYFVLSIAIVALLCAFVRNRAFDWLFAIVSAGIWVGWGFLVRFTIVF
jgi:hypothetical protein